MRFSQRKFPRRLLFIALLMTLVGFGGLSLARAQSNQVCFPETGFCTSGRFLSFWQENGGLSAFGYPITAQGTELIQGQPFEVQWFERQRFERHPENAAPFDVLLGRLGADRLAQLGLNWFDFPKADPTVAAANGCIFVPETQHSICGEFLTAFRSFGLNFPGVPGISYEESVAFFGLPLSEPMTMTIDGRELTVQWFERARFELHPENARPFNVLFGLLGREVLTANLAPAPTAPPLTPTPAPSATPLPQPPVVAPSITIDDPAADTTVVNGFRMRGTTTFYPSDADLEYRVIRRDTGAQIGAGFFFLQNSGGPPFNWSVQIFFDASYSGPIQVEVTDIDRSSGAVYARTTRNYTAQSTGQ